MLSLNIKILLFIILIGLIAIIGCGGGDNGTTTNPDTTAPANPTGLIATPENTEVILNWTANTEDDLAKYEVYKSTHASEFEAEYYSAVTTNTETVTSLTNGITYFFWVTAEDKSGNESGYSNRVETIPISITAPTGLIATVGDEKVILNWTANTDSDFLKYKVYTSLSVSTPEYHSETTSNSATISSLTNGTTYFFWVTAVDTSNNESQYSNIVEAIPVKIKAPTGLIAIIGDSKVMLNWTANSESSLAKYNIYISLDTSTPEYHSESMTNSATIDSLSNGTTYFFWVTALDTSDCESAYSNIVEAIPAKIKAPTGLIATTGDGKVILNWTANSEGSLVKYNIYT